MTFQSSLTTSQLLKVIDLISSGKPVKVIAGEMGVSNDVIYGIRSRYFKQIWVLKRHPEDCFQLNY